MIYFCFHEQCDRRFCLMGAAHQLRRHHEFSGRYHKLHCRKRNLVTQVVSGEGHEQFEIHKTGHTAKSNPFSGFLFLLSDGAGRSLYLFRLRLCLTKASSGTAVHCRLSYGQSSPTAWKKALHPINNRVRIKCHSVLVGPTTYS